MAASVALLRKFAPNIDNFCILGRIVCHPEICNIRCKVHDTNEAQVDDSMQYVEENTDEIEAKRDVSRLPGHLRQRMLHIKSPPTDEFKAQVPWGFSRPTQRRVYAQYGRKSGVNPGIMWDSKEELADKIEDEKEWEPTLQERWAIIAAKKKEAIETKKELEVNIEKNMSRMPTMIEKYKEKLYAGDEVEKRQEAKRAALLQEAREFFGYNIDPKDPRFKAMQEMKAEEELKQKKLKKKQDKQNKFLDEIQRVAAGVGGKKADAPAKDS